MSECQRHTIMFIYSIKLVLYKQLEERKRVFIVLPSYQQVWGGQEIGGQRDTIDGRGWIPGPSQTCFCVFR
jgi:hypothetical protein